MSSSSKVQKLSSDEDEDRISKLSDPILTHILSFLPTKFAVGSTVLSKRWRSPCLSLPNLDFDDSASIYPGLICGYPRQKLSFMNFVDRILMMRENGLNLERFSLSCVGNYDSTRVENWVRIAIGHMVKEINLSFNFRGPFELPRDIFMCETVAILRLSWKILINVPEHVCLSRLKVLKLNGVKFSSYESIEKLLHNCPVLEDLVVKNCKWLSGCSLYICGASLKNLSLQSNATVDEEIELKIVIDAPTLETLIIKEYTSEDILIKKNLMSLVTANIDVAQKIERFVPSSVYGDHVFGLLKEISHVKFLTLSHDTLGALSCASRYSFPTFCDLKQLELDVDGWSGWNLLPNLLASSPILENLLFPQGLIQFFYFQRQLFRFLWSPPELVPECLSFHLKTVEIRNFRGIAEEFTLVKYLLKNAKVLRRMSIDCSLLMEDVKIQKKLFKFRRGSPTCELDIMF